MKFSGRRHSPFFYLVIGALALVASFGVGFGAGYSADSVCDYHEQFGPSYKLSLDEVYPDVEYNTDSSQVLISLTARPHVSPK